MRICSTALLLLIFNSFLFSQKIIEPVEAGDNYDKKCASCVAELEAVKDTADFGLFSDDSLNYYFYMTSREAFEKIFVKKYGIATDVILRSQFSCNKREMKYDERSLIKGKLMPAFWGKKFQAMAQYSGDSVIVPLGKLPAEISQELYELNLLVLNKKLNCQYRIGYNVGKHKVGQAEIGMFADTTMFGSNLFDFDSTKLFDNTLFSINTLLKDTVMPDIELMRTYEAHGFDGFRIDSALLVVKHQAFDIKPASADKKAKYLENLISYIEKNQGHKISIRYSEDVDWDGLQESIAGSTFEFLADLSEDEIIERMGQDNLAQRMSEIFDKKYTGELIFFGEEHGSLKKTSRDSLVLLFNQAVRKNDIKAANKIFNTALLRIKAKEFYPSFVESFSIPFDKQYMQILVKASAFSYLADNVDYEQTVDVFNRLKELEPNDRSVNYNLISLEFDLWRVKPDSVNPTELSKQMKALARMNVSSKLINKMYVNYYINMADYYHLMKDETAKEKALKGVYSYYRKTPLSAKEKIGISEFFISHDKYKWAIKLLYPSAKSSKATEDLVFYFIDKTISDNSMTNRSAYVAILNKAYELNPERTCKMFASNLKGGVSFQLLSGRKIRSFDCAKCAQPENPDDIRVLEK